MLLYSLLSIRYVDILSYLYDIAYITSLKLWAVVMPDEPLDPHDQNKFKMSMSEGQLAELLLRRFGSYYKDVFVDICRMISQGNGYNTQRYLIGHLISELDGAIRTSLLPIVPAKEPDKKKLADEATKKAKVIKLLKELKYPDAEGCAKVKAVLNNLEEPDNHGSQIKKIIDSLKLDQNIESIKFWQKMKLHKYRHLPRGGKILKVDDNLIEIWDQFQSALRYLLAGVEKRYTAYIQIVDDIKDLPSEESLKKLKSIPNNILTQRQFFDGNENPLWLPLLEKEGYFKDPPNNQEKFDDEKSLNSVHWPAAEYLARMAARDDSELKQKVFDIVIQIPPTDNRWVHLEIIKIAKVLPPELSVKLYKKIEESARVVSGILFLRDIGETIKYWAEAGKGEEALSLLKVVINQRIKDDDDRTGGSDNYEYGRLLKIIRGPLALINATDTLKYLSEILDSELKAKYEGGRDYLYIGLPNVGIETESSRGIIYDLVAAIRVVSTEALANGHIQFSEIHKIFSEYPWDIFQRLIMYIAAEDPAGARDTVTFYLMSEKEGRTYSRQNEYKKLALEGFETLRPENQAKIIERLENGPQDIVERMADYTKHTGSPTTEADIQRYKDIWLRDEISGWSEVLPPEWGIRYEELIRKVGEPSERGVRIMRGPESPVDIEELQNWSIAEVAQYLKEWHGERGIRGPSPDGLRLELKKLVKAKTDLVLSDIELFFGLKPTYIRGILNALSEKIRNQEEINWDKALTLCEWVITQKDDDSTAESEDDFDDDNGWKWTYSEVGNLLELGLKLPEEKEIPLAMRPRIWAVIIALSKYKEIVAPETDYEDTFHRAGSTVQGQALECAVHYALWIKRQLTKTENAPKDFQDGLQEVENLFNDILNSPDTAFLRSIFGRYYPWIQWLDKNWAKINAHKIFLEPLTLDSAWIAYILYSGGPYRDVYELIADLYEKAITELNTVPREEKEDYYQNLGHDFIALLSYQVIRIGDKILDDYFQNAPDQDRASAIWYCSRILSEPSLKPEATKALMDLAEVRIKQITSSNDPIKYKKELKRYGLWIGSTHLPDEWQLNLLENILNASDETEREDETFKFLAKVFQAYPDRVLSCLEKVLFESKIDTWEIRYSKEHIGKILLDASASEDEKIRVQAEEIRNRLVADGHNSYLDLNKTDQPEVSFN